MEFYNIIGSFGTGLIILAYFLLQIKKISVENISFSLMNIFGSLFILYSLYYEYNLPSVIIESFWILISLIGIFRKKEEKGKN